MILKNGLSGNQLKLLAALFMVIDHIGLLLFPNIALFRVIGRLAFPMFAFFIAEGCRYTKDRLRHFLTMALFAAISQTVYSAFSGDYQMCIFVTFSVSIIWTYALYFVKDTLFEPNGTRVKLFCAISLAAMLLGGIIFAVIFFDIDLDYGIAGALVPVIVSLAHPPKNAPQYWERIDTPITYIILLFVGILALCIGMPYIQLFSLLSLIPIALYSGKRGRARLKYFFYIFYPVHLVALYGLTYLILK